ncbi:MAG: glycosyltransferase family 1 protein, partial [Candidatus Kerfeldbacteria bacterium]|nr:glycosyltransferase family 1 protein [Candidatus Kerfeldbacteria bacterium]
IIELANDPAKRKQMGEAGRKKSLTYAWPKVVDRIEEVYKQVFKKPKTP